MPEIPELERQSQEGLQVRWWVNPTKSASYKPSEKPWQLSESWQDGSMDKHAIEQS